MYNILKWNWLSTSLFGYIQWPVDKEGVSFEKFGKDVVRGIFFGILWNRKYIIIRYNQILSYDFAEKYSII